MKKLIIDGDTLDMFKELDLDEIGYIIMAMGGYCQNDTLAFEDMPKGKAVRIALNYLKKQVDKGFEKELEISMKRSEAGKKGAQKKWKE